MPPRSIPLFSNVNPVIPFNFGLVLVTAASYVYYKKKSVPASQIDSMLEIYKPFYPSLTDVNKARITDSKYLKHLSSQDNPIIVDLDSRLKDMMENDEGYDPQDPRGKYHYIRAIVKHYHIRPSSLFPIDDMNPTLSKPPSNELTRRRNYHDNDELYEQQSAEDYDEVNFNSLDSLAIKAEYLSHTKRGSNGLLDTNSTALHITSYTKPHVENYKPPLPRDLANPRRRRDRLILRSADGSYDFEDPETESFFFESNEITDDEESAYMQFKRKRDEEEVTEPSVDSISSTDTVNPNDTGALRIINSLKSQMIQDQNVLQLEKHTILNIILSLYYAEFLAFHLSPPRVSGDPYDTENSILINKNLNETISSFYSPPTELTDFLEVLDSQTSLPYYTAPLKMRLESYQTNVVDHYVNLFNPFISFGGDHFPDLTHTFSVPQQHILQQAFDEAKSPPSSPTSPYYNSWEYNALSQAPYPIQQAIADLHGIHRTIFPSSKPFWERIGDRVNNFLYPPQRDHNGINWEFYDAAIGGYTQSVTIRAFLEDYATKVYNFDILENSYNNPLWTKIHANILPTPIFYQVKTLTTDDIPHDQDLKNNEKEGVQKLSHKNLISVVKNHTTQQYIDAFHNNPTQYLSIVNNNNNNNTTLHQTQNNSITANYIIPLLRPSPVLFNILGTYPELPKMPDFDENSTTLLQQPQPQLTPLTKKHIMLMTNPILSTTTPTVVTCLIPTIRHQLFNKYAKNRKKSKTDLDSNVNFNNFENLDCRLKHIVYPQISPALRQTLYPEALQLQLLQSRTPDVHITSDELATYTDHAILLKQQDIVDTSEFDPITGFNQDGEHRDDILSGNAISQTPTRIIKHLAVYNPPLKQKLHHIEILNNSIRNAYYTKYGSVLYNNTHQQLSTLLLQQQQLTAANAAQDLSYNQIVQTAALNIARNTNLVFPILPHMMSPHYLVPYLQDSAERGPSALEIRNNIFIRPLRLKTTKVYRDLYINHNKSQLYNPKKIDPSRQPRITKFLITDEEGGNENENELTARRSNPFSPAFVEMLLITKALPIISENDFYSHHRNIKH